MNRLKSKKIYPAMFVILIILMAWMNTDACAAAKKSDASPEIAPPTLGTEETFYKNEGAHFENTYEFWAVSAWLNIDGKKAWFMEMFHKAGSVYIHTRNGYSSLRIGDKFDYRSFGQGAIRTIATGRLKKLIADYPNDAVFKESLDNMRNDTSKHFKTLADNEQERALFRGRLFIDFADNEFERISKDSFDYKLQANTWAGILTLSMSSMTDPLLYDQQHIIKVGKNEMQGYFMPRLAVSGMLTENDSVSIATGTADFVHLWADLEPQNYSKYVFFTQRLSNGGSLFLANFYGDDGKKTGDIISYMRPDGTVVHKLDAEIRPSGKTWKSSISRTTYNVNWKISGADIDGVLEPVALESEAMIDQGAGAFWYGPCTFKGKLKKSPDAAPVTGEGFCRMVGSMDKPEKPASKGK